MIEKCNISISYQLSAISFGPVATLHRTVYAHSARYCSRSVRVAQSVLLAEG
ncbi:hypothetical protein [Moorena sp. SIO2C4]|uniref:hypothetical protein n=1 Tax=Moorena sp. SIO2C4 TaxID=2607824 RepID=UPI0013C06071|nr:hypothetical protein [Moorena sp. SIO2C4]NEQ16947.1 hypothetical protein [Moorena sp. SIO3E2]NES46221.1 hypothetical protein [Moorena sp. SIO2C4]